MRRKNYHIIYIDKEVIFLYQKGMRPNRRPSLLPPYHILVELKEKHTAKTIGGMFKVHENAVWAALKRGKK